MHYPDIHKVIHTPLKVAIVIVVFLAMYAAAPIGKAHAAAILTDNFDSGINTPPWYNSHPSANNMGWQSTGCYSGGGCIVYGGSGTSRMMGIGTPLTAGSQVIYFKGTNGSNVLIHICQDTTSGSPDTCDQQLGSTNFYDIAHTSDYDNNWHFYYFAWKDVGGTSEFCGMIDDSNDSDCGYTDEGLSRTAGNYQAMWIQEGSGNNIVFDELSSPVAPPPPDVSTRIISVVPSSGSIIATSTSFVFGATGYINSGDLGSSTQVQLSYESNGCLYAGVSVYTTVAFPCVSGSFTWLATTAGAFGVSTTTSIGVLGGYAMTTKIVNPYFSIFGFTFGTQTLVSTSTVFTAATSTLLDELHVVSVQTLANLASTTAIAAGACNPADFSDFNLGVCIGSLFVPDPQLVQGLENGIEAQTLTTLPFEVTIGVMAALDQSTTTTASLPQLSINLNDTHLPSVSGVPTVTFDVFDNLLGGASILATATSTSDGKTLQQIAESGWDTFVYISAGLMIVVEILGIGGKVISTL